MTGQDFEVLQQRARLKMPQRVAAAAATAVAQLHLFDVLMVDGKDVGSRDLVARRALVQQIISSVDGAMLRRVEWFDGASRRALRGHTPDGP
jgi:ATP-dependent DNA ligase